MILRSLVALSLVGTLACGSSSADPTSEGLNGDPSNPNNGFTPGANMLPDAGPGGLSGDAGSAPPGTDSGSCTKPNLTGTVRDFKDSHADFEKFNSDVGEKNAVERMLGADFKPVYSAGGSHAFFTGKANFDQWFRDVPGVNQKIPLTLELTKGPGSISTYQNNNFFPADGKGFGNEGREHNFHFTFELHTEFVYNGGEVFTFTGDDDLWTFINGRLAIDLGGVHPALSATIRLDDMAAELGIERGKTYGLSVFQAERHTTASNFRIDTNIAFTNCAPIIK